MQGAITLATTLGKGSKVRCHRSTLNQADDFKKVVADANITPAYLESPDRLQVEILVAMDRWNARPAWLLSCVLTTPEEFVASFQSDTPDCLT